MSRIMVIGPSGAGKSTLARQLGSLLKMDVIHLDRRYWNAGWRETPKPEWSEKVAAMTQGEEWIIDGNYSSTMDIRLKRADRVVFLDFSRARCIVRAVKRRIQWQGKTRPDMAEGCPERIDWKFLKWIWTYPKRSRPATLERLKHLPPGTKVYVLNKPREVKNFLAKVKREGTL